MKYNITRKRKINGSIQKQKKSVKYKKKNKNSKRTRKIRRMKGGNMELNGSFLSKLVGTQEHQEMTLEDRNGNYLV